MLPLSGPMGWRRLGAVLWPAFLMAGVLEAIVFSAVDPADLWVHARGHAALSDTAVYTLAFFVFWGVITTAGLITLLLDQPADEVNATPPAPEGAVSTPRR
jgi:hypothetical protein